MPSIRDIEAEKLDPARVTLESLRNHPELVVLINRGDACVKASGGIEHGIFHAARTSVRAYKLCREIGLPERDAELATLAAYMHDMGYAIESANHAYTGAIMARSLLREAGTSLGDTLTICHAIANHAIVASPMFSYVAAAVTLADASDVLRSRVRNPAMKTFTQDDRLNFGVIANQLDVDENRVITLNLSIDTPLLTPLEFMEIFVSRWKLIRCAAETLRCELRLSMNGAVLV